MNSEIEILEDYESSDDEVIPEITIKRKHCTLCPEETLRKRIKFEDKTIDGWFNYMRAYVPLMKLMLEDYKVKWESYQYMLYARMNDPYFHESDYDSDTSNGTVTSAIIGGFPHGETDDSVVLCVSRKNIRPGFYMFLSYFQGGWCYSQVKKYFRQKHGVRCFRSETTRNALRGQNDYRALIKFRTENARRTVFTKISKKNMLNYFMFVCVDANEEYFNDTMIAKLRNTRGCIGLPSFFVSMRR